jgi:hypothetical protein
MIALFYRRALKLGVVSLLVASCAGEEPEGIAPAQSAATTVKMDFFHLPLPEIPLPNDIATRYDATSATGRRINASMIAPTQLESDIRMRIDQLDGWGTMQPIAIPFTGPIDPMSVIAGHDDVDYNTSDDVLYLINVDPDSPAFGELAHLDIGQGNYPMTLERGDYGPHDPRGWTLSLVFDEADEDLNDNGVLDPGEDANRNRLLDAGEDRDGDGVLDGPEDTDADGYLDVPNYLPGLNPAREDLTARADALMTFYERQTNTLIARPMVPLLERTTYAVVVTRRIKDAAGNPVGSPYPSINHVGHNAALAVLPDVLPAGLALSDVAFAFSYTTGTNVSEWLAVRDGLYGHGVQAHLGRDFPAELGELYPLRDPEEVPGRGAPWVLYQEQWTQALQLIATGALGLETGTAEFASVMRSTRYVDFHIMGSYESPQLFNRYDANGEFLPYNAQSWPADLDRVAAPARSETVSFWLAVPRREISRRGDGQPAPVVILGHGYGSNRLEALTFAGYLAEHGVATLAIDNASHGLFLDPETREQVETVVSLFGLGPFLEAVQHGRIYDFNRDGELVSGADFWTSYLFHTRDVLRQTVLDYMQLVRILRTFDGTTRWDFDIDGDGQPELAGDFDADGVVDVSASAGLHGLGGSLGGMTATLLGSLEPAMSTIVPISGGGGLADLGIRSQQGGVREAFIFWAMGPIYTVQPGEAGASVLGATLADLNDLKTITIADLTDVQPGDTIVAENLTNLERDCGYISAEGTARVQLPSDVGDSIRFSIYSGPALVTGDDDCAVIDGAMPTQVVDRFGRDVEFQNLRWRTGDALVSVVEGLGLRRAEPDLRRFSGLGAMVLDRCDPAVYAPFLSRTPLTYPGTGETTTTNALIVTTAGDMNVPASGGLTLGRAAGYIPYLESDERWGVPANQVIIDTYHAEAVHTLKRYTNATTGEGVHIDIENFSEGTDIWGTDVPRLEEPLHLWAATVTDEGAALGGQSGAIFPYPVPEGQHGFPFPGQLPDRAEEQCEEACTEGSGCDCSDVATFDTGAYLFNMFGRYISTDGAEVHTEMCQSTGDCEWFNEPPPARPLPSLR